MKVVYNKFSQNAHTQKLPIVKQPYHIEEEEEKE